MSLRSTAVRLSVSTAGAALAALIAAGPALAAPAPHPLPAAPSVVPPSHPGPAPAGATEQTYYGRVIARTGLVLRDAPNRHGKIIRVEPYGAIVPIYCKVIGENVDGNHLWYLLTDGTWAWGAARYIENIGPAPRWC